MIVGGHLANFSALYPNRFFPKVHYIYAGSLGAVKIRNFMQEAVPAQCTVPDTLIPWI